jgi:hypothetical protein
LRNSTQTEEVAEEIKTGSQERGRRHPQSWPYLHDNFNERFKSALTLKVISANEHLPEQTNNVAPAATFDKIIQW